MTTLLQLRATDAERPDRALSRTKAAAGVAEATRLGAGAAWLSPSSLLRIQRSAGNRAATRLLQREETGEEKAKGSCGCTGGGCSCQRRAEAAGTEAGGALAGGGLALQRHPGGHGGDEEVQLSVQLAKNGPAVKPVDYTKTHTCGFGEGVRVFSSWAYAVGKLMENLPALELSYVTGLATPNLTRNLKKNFNVDPKDKKARQKVLKKLIPGYNKILGVMGSGLASVKCGGPECEAGDFAYIWPADKDNVIYLCDTQFAADTPTMDLGCMWVHELSHKRLGTDDLNYYSAGGSTTLATDDALNNADCWGNFMVGYI